MATFRGVPLADVEPLYHLYAVHYTSDAADIYGGDYMHIVTMYNTYAHGSYK